MNGMIGSIPRPVHSMEGARRHPIGWSTASLPAESMGVCLLGDVVNGERVLNDAL